MIYFIFLVLLFVAIFIDGLSVYCTIKEYTRTKEEKEKIETFTKENGVCDSGKSLDEVKGLTFYSLNDLGLY